MCGGEPNIRIEKAGNGFLVDSYTPGGRDNPGTHKRHVAMNGHHVIHIVKKHLGAKVEKEKKSTKKRVARKRG